MKIFKKNLFGYNYFLRRDILFDFLKKSIELYCTRRWKPTHWRHNSFNIEHFRVNLWRQRSKLPYLLIVKQKLTSLDIKYWNVDVNDTNNVIRSTFKAFLLFFSLGVMQLLISDYFNRKFYYS